MSKYGLKFEKKLEACEELLKSHHIYLEDDAQSFVRDVKKHHNVLIEGENLHALKILQYTHEGKVDVIYIDPPYNTGNKDFVYNDAFVDEEDGFRHSKWLSFMEKRLKIARELLSDRGVIFLSIDDNEFAQLKLLCDEVFGEQNFIANLIWKNKFNGGYDAEFITIEHEYILVYAKDKNNAHLNYVPFNVEDDKAYKFEDQYKSTRGKFKVMNLDDKSLKHSESLDFVIKAPDGSDISPENCWRWGKEKVKWGIDNGFIEIVNPKGVWRVNKKQYQYCDNEGNSLVRAYPLRSIVDGVSNTNSGNEIKDLFGDKTVFQYAKPVELIKRLLSIGSKKDSTILDFFAGSGTTGQAVTELNKEDGGTRQFILVTNNDKSDKLPKGICEQVTYPRLEKTIGNENLKVLKVTSLKKAEGINSQIVQLELNNTLVPILCLANNTFNQLEKTATSLVYGNHSNKKHIGVYSNSNGKQKPINLKTLEAFVSKLEKEYPDALLFVNRPARGYVREYFNFMK